MATALGQRNAIATMSGRWRDFDLFMLMTTMVLIGFGIIAIWSAHGLDQAGLNQAARQGVFAIIGVSLMLGIAAVDYRFLASLAWPIYAVGLAGLIAVPIIGINIGGSQRWISAGPLGTIQPSEFARVSTLIALAAFVSSRGSAMREIGNIFVAGLIIAVPAGLVFIEPDLGGAILYGVMFLAVMLVARTRFVFFLLGVIASPLMIWLAWRFILFDYQKDRLMISFDPWRDPMGDGYNIIQAWTAIGAGGWFGAGLAGGTQSQFNLLKVRESDFIFSHVSSMFGFVGMLALLTCYVILLWRCIRAVELSRDHFGQCLAMGITGMLFFQTVLNLGINIGLMPVTGVTLPFVSQGSTSLWTYLFSIGILQSILLGHRRFAFQRGH